MLTVEQMLAFTERIQGWMSKEERVWLYEQAHTIPIGGTWIEVGVWKGRSFFAVAAGLPYGAWLHGVDHYRGSANERGRGKGHHEADAPDDRVLAVLSNHLREFRRTCRPDVNFGLLMGESREAARWCFRRGQADAVFIDGAHDQASVESDLVEWLPIVRAGGLLAGHDLDVKHPGVAAALNRVGVAVEQPVASIWRRV